jgi:oxaloacetate decarboxylase gamma subunit
MPITDLLLSGLELMLVGMGIVFGFLLLLVLFMLGMSRFSLLMGEKQPLALSQAQTPEPETEHHGLRGDLVAVIAAAVTRYRTTHH